MKILIIEDEKMLADSIKTMLEGRGFQAEAVYDGETGADYAELGIYDLLILDVMMPKMDGYQVARHVRSQRCGTPILMLTARSSVEDRIEGLNAGADYYLTKPFDMRELMACINALLRRQGNQVDEMVFGNTALDLATSMLICGEKSVRLSAKEFDVMRLLLQYKAGASAPMSESRLCADSAIIWRLTKLDQKTSHQVRLLHHADCDDPADPVVDCAGQLYPKEHGERTILCSPPYRGRS